MLICAAGRSGPRFLPARSSTGSSSTRIDLMLLDTHSRRLMPSGGGNGRTGTSPVYAVTLASASAASAVRSALGRRPWKIRRQTRRSARRSPSRSSRDPRELLERLWRARRDHGGVGSTSSGAPSGVGAPREATKPPPSRTISCPAAASTPRARRSETARRTGRLRPGTARTRSCRALAAGTRCPQARRSTPRPSADPRTRSRAPRAGRRGPGAPAARGRAGCR